jgi:adenylate cyclase
MIAAQPERRLGAALVADVVGYSRLIERDEAGTLARYNAHRKELVEPLLAEHRGRLVKLTGDGWLCEFASVVDAVGCAVAIQKSMAERERDVREIERIRFRIGVNLGDLIIEDNDIHGDAVNVAARLEGLAEPGGICVSSKVREEVSGRLPFAFRDLGERHLKNIVRPVRVYQLVTELEREDESWPGPRSTLCSIAVLPFDNLAEDQRWNRLADGLSADIITDLARQPDLRVIARHTVLSYKGRSADVLTISSELDVGYILEGNVQATGRRVRVSVQLVDAGKSAALWSARYDRPDEDLFAIQDEITEKVVNALVTWGGQLGRARGERAKRKPPTSLEAYELYLLGVEQHDTLTQEGNAEGIRLLSRAVELDPGLARAWTALALAHHVAELYGFTDDRPAANRKWRECTERALALDPSEPKAHVMMGDIHARARDLVGATDEYQRALAAAPNDADALAFLAGSFCLVVGDPEKATGLVRRAIHLNPGAPGLDAPAWYHLQLGRTEYVRGNYRKCIEALHHAPRNAPATLMFLAMARAQLGEIEQAGELVTQLSTQDLSFTVAEFIHNFPVTNPPALAAIRDGAAKAGLLPAPHSLPAAGPHGVTC